MKVNAANTKPQSSSHVDEISSQDAPNECRLGDCFLSPWLVMTVRLLNEGDLVFSHYLNTNRVSPFR